MQTPSLRLTHVIHSTKQAFFRALAATVVTIGTVTACNGGDAITSSNLTAPSPATVVALSGDGQTAVVGAALGKSLVARVVNAGGVPVTGVTVAFQVITGSASLSANTAVTDINGDAQTQVVAGNTAGVVVVTATLQNTLAASTSFSMTVTQATATGSCVPVTLAVGGALTISGSSACVAGGGALAEYALIPFNASPNASSRATVAVKATGVSSVTASLASASSIGAFTSTGAVASVSARRAFEVGLRTRERAAMTTRLASARSWNTSGRSSTGARLALIPSTATVGSLYSLNANADDACSRASLRAGRVMAVGRKALIVADTLNPAGGFTSAEYATIAETFDNVVDAVDTKSFGEPTDIDGNGHVVLFFTSAVNALTPREAGYYVGGFFYGRDLLPTTGTSSLDACAASNVAEMFYLLVPDPSGTINGNAFSKSFVLTNTIGTTAHEYQHLINASRRMYVNAAATSLEETWLDEGLAHVAEELVFNARSGLSPLANIDATLLRSNTTYRTAFNDEGISNFQRLSSFLENPSANSLYANNDSLATRGATWSFLRYAADQQPGAQETVWNKLVNSNFTGLANMRQVFSDLTPLMRDWATSLLLDDVAGASPRYQFASWNLRSIFGALSTNGTYPMATQSLSNETAVSVTVAGGGAAYLRFGVAAGGTGSVSWTAPSSNVQATLVRLR